MAVLLRSLRLPCSPIIALHKTESVNDIICRRSSSSLSSSENASSNSKQTNISTITPSYTYSIKESSDEINFRNRVKIIPLGQGIFHVRLSRPDKLNSLDLDMFDAIAEAAARLRDDAALKKNLRVVIFSGEGKAFCTGLDAKSVALSGPGASVRRLLERPSPFGGEGEGPKGNLAQDVCYLWRTLPVPVITVIHGMCFGGGLQIALGGDIRLSTFDCKISIMESRWGLIPDMGITITLRELVRMDVAKELTMTGRIINGIEAERIGLVTRCVEDPMKEAMKVAMEIVERSPDSVAATKQLFQSTWVADDQTCLNIETDLQKKLIGTWNMVAASSRQFGVNLPYYKK